VACQHVQRRNLAEGPSDPREKVLTPMAESSPDRGERAHRLAGFPMGTRGSASGPGMSRCCVRYAGGAADVISSRSDRVAFSVDLVVRASRPPWCNDCLCAQDRAPRPQAHPDLFGHPKPYYTPRRRIIGYPLPSGRRGWWRRPHACRFRPTSSRPSPRFRAPRATHVMSDGRRKSTTRSAPRASQTGLECE